MSWQQCTLEQAIRLRVLGVTQKSDFYWVEPKSENHRESIQFGWTSFAIASAFTVAELGVLMGEFNCDDPKKAASDLAIMLISDLENGIKNVDDINQRSLMKDWGLESA